MLGHFHFDVSLDHGSYFFCIIVYIEIFLNCKPDVMVYILQSLDYVIFLKNIEFCSDGQLIAGRFPLPY